mgnify:CR=1 FL=1
MASRRGAKKIVQILEFIIPQFDLEFEQDEIVLGAGHHEVFIPIERPIKRVWFTFTDARRVPVCQGDIDRCGVTVQPDGFTIYADIYSDRRGIRWFAMLGDEPGDAQTNMGMTDELEMEEDEE